MRLIRSTTIPVRLTGEDEVKAMKRHLCLLPSFLLFQMTDNIQQTLPRRAVMNERNERFWVQILTRVS